MAAESIDRQPHWQKIYRTKTAESVSCYRPHLDVSIELLGLAGLSADSRVASNKRGSPQHTRCRSATRIKLMGAVTSVQVP